MVGLAVVTLYLLLPWVGKGVQWNARWIAAGMTQEQVEALLGPPNVLAGTKNQQFWDAYTFGDCGRYVAITVYYDEEERVDRTQVSTFWRPPWR